VCEIDPDVLALAREHLGLRRQRGLHVRVADGRAFVARQPAASCDAIAIDAFVGAAVPRRLITVEAFSDAARVAPLTLVNVLDDRSARELRLVAAALATAYPRVWALGGRTGNTIVVGAGRGVAVEPERIRAQAAADPSPARLRTADAIALMVGGMPALRDIDLDTI
jgi:lambda repressor-like predicted transcriptional regulator